MTFTFVEHTAELEIRIEAADVESVFADALAAFRELVAGDEEGEPAEHEVALEATDRATLLAEWISELVFLADVHAFVPEGVARLELAEQSLRATVAGRRDEPRPLVKAVTYHRLGLWYDGGVWHARLVVDV